jgi:hypothetical protein
MTEVEVNGTSGGLDLDFTETKASLASSSTRLRIGLLHTLEERLSKNGKKISTAITWKQYSANLSVSTKSLGIPDGFK